MTCSKQGSEAARRTGSPQARWFRALSSSGALDRGGPHPVVQKRLLAVARPRDDGRRRARAGLPVPGRAVRAAGALQQPGGPARTKCEWASLLAPARPRTPACRPGCTAHLLDTPPDSTGLQSRTDSATRVGRLFKQGKFVCCVEGARLSWGQTTKPAAEQWTRHQHPSMSPLCTGLNRSVTRRAAPVLRHAARGRQHERRPHRQRPDPARAPAAGRQPPHALAQVHAPSVAAAGRVRHVHQLVHHHLRRPHAES